MLNHGTKSTMLLLCCKSSLSENKALTCVSIEHVTSK